MPGRFPAEAVTAFVRPLQRALECLTDAVLVVQKGGYHPFGQPHGLTLNGGIPAAIGRGASLHLSVSLRYSIIDDRHVGGSWLVRPTGYIFAFSDDAKRPLLAYHWHPDGGSRVPWPHIHVYDPSLNPSSILSRAHLPTGRVLLEDVIQLAIVEFGVQPRSRHAANWSDVLQETRALLADQR